MVAACLRERGFDKLGKPPETCETVRGRLRWGCDSLSSCGPKSVQPPGARKLDAPNFLATQVGSFGANQVIAVDGWIHGPVAYPMNLPPLKSDVGSIWPITARRVGHLIGHARHAKKRI